jgi:phosphatidylserine decarboxylase
MAATRYLFLAREGVPPVLLFGASALLVHYHYGAAWSLPLWAAVLLLAWLFRDPEREAPAAPLAVLSPSDGTVAAVERRRDPFLDRAVIAIGIDMSPLGSYATRSPIEGKIMQRWHSVAGPEELNPSGFGIWVQTDEGDDVVLVLHRASRLNRPRCDVQPGERIGHGKRCGFVPFGSRIDVLVPVSSRVAVSPCDRVRAGADVIATLVHKPAAANAG